MTDIRLFAASNSSRGFRSYFSECFGAGSGVERLYIIKGGPGTGKSYFMRTVARYAASRGYRVTEYYCSSDPTSLDGIRLDPPHGSTEPCVALVDGTPPHVCEPTFAGVREELINLGQFWNGERLRSAAADIRALSAGKSQAYAMAYAHLRAAGEMDAVSDGLTDGCVDSKRLRSLASRLLRGLPEGDGFAVTPALCSAIGMTGEVRFDTYERLASKGELVRISDYYGLGYRLMRELMSLTKEKGQRAWVAYNPVLADKIEALYYPATGLCIVLGEETDDDSRCRSVTLRRYADAEALRRVRGEIRHARHLYCEMLDGALRCLDRVAEQHFALEKIYSASMNFGEQSAYCANFCKTVFG